jgi:all-trans-8'-apo-beta-carotenal 15,15'-oxygenase
MTLSSPTASDRSYSLHNWQGGHQSLKQEHSYWINEVDGQIPSDLRGTLFRNGPGMLDVNGEPLHHPFDGDGMICAIAFEQGRAHFRNCFVRTEGYVAEQAAGKILYRGVFGTQKPGGWLANAFDLNFKNIANTNVIYWGGKLLALWEADQPYRLNPATLETLGLDDLSGLLKPKTPFSAHPRILPRTDGSRLVNFSVQSGPLTSITIYEFDEAGSCVKQRQHTIPGFAFIHDFAVTEHYYIFFQNPVNLNPFPFLVGLRGAGECLEFQPHQPTKIWLIPRDAQQAVQKLTTDACFVFHHANAFEQDGTIIVDSVCYDTFPSLDADQEFREIDFDTVPSGQLWRFQIDVEAQTVKRQCTTTHSCEFPTLNPAKASNPYQYLFIGATHSRDRNAPLQSILKLDLQSGKQEQWSAAPEGFVGEPIFVPKAEGEGEDAGWILSLIYNATDHRSQVVILDGEDISQGPVARLHLTHHVPYGLHGTFTPHVWEKADV